MKKMGGSKMKKMMAQMQEMQAGGNPSEGMPDISKLQLPGFGGKKFPF